MIVLALLAAAPHVDCAKAMTQLDMNMCAGERLEKADKALNATWKQAQQRAKAQGDMPRLLDAQRKWLAYRDAHCLALNGPRTDGGSMWPMQQSACLASLTEERTRNLRIIVDAPR